MTALPEGVGDQAALSPAPVEAVADAAAALR